MPSVEQVLVFYLSILVLTHNNHFTIIRMTLKFQPRNFWSNLSNSLLRLRTETHLKMGLYMYSRGSKYTGSLHKIRFHSLEKTDVGKIEVRRRRGDRGWDGWMESPTQWTWVWANSGRQWRTGKPGVLHFMGSQRVGHDLPTEQQQQQTGSLSKIIF